MHIILCIMITRLTMGLNGPFTLTKADMKKVFYISKNIYGFISYENFRDLKYGIVKTAILQCNVGSYAITIDDIKE